MPDEPLATGHQPPPLLTTKHHAVESPAPETVAAAAAVKELAEAPKEEKKQIAVDHKLVINEVQLLLAEKRTSFALLRTGVSVALVPLSLISLLIATSKLWNVWDVYWILVPLALVLMLLVSLGGYLILHALHHLAHNDRVLIGLRASDTLLEDLLASHGRGDRFIKPWKWRKGEAWYSSGRRSS
jgi:hypothetical protein